MELQSLINRYLEAHKNAWAASTLKSEASRLKRATRFMQLAPAEAHQEMVELKYGSYTIRIMFVRIADFFNWAIDESLAPGPNQWRKFLNHNANLFKGVYEKERLDVTFEEAKKLVAGIADESVKRTGLQILASGARSREILNLLPGNEVRGKGGKVRTLFLPPDLSGRTGNEPSYRALYRELRKIGLKPHTLRKLAATNFGEHGADEATLLRLMGWTSMQTAIAYLQPKKDERIKKLVEEAFGTTKAK